ncbi:glycosyltransferase [uncultured Psychrosphaera sp.]|uniref:glycosyltransferase n=1 Tax=uncultured Psychrosphaera sp. TaxID=1403522 RepID=UPI00262534E9|nr:glycosyltransferase [uncultured Psychrosphaera sp.]
MDKLNSNAASYLDLTNSFSDSHMSEKGFRQSLQDEFSQFISKQEERFPIEDCLKIDLHCHDHNSDIPDELWGRILRLPETWLKTKKLVKNLKANDCDAITITNHNNARSCWALQEKNVDVLVAAEFTCYFPEYELYIHILTYGFNQKQENMLNKKRQNVYEFVKYAAEQDIPLIVPHPLYFYTKNDKIDITLFEKMAVMFTRFEVLNGQRDLWQSVLTLNWVESLNAEKINQYAKKHDLNLADYNVDPNQAKILTGGSDDHTGIFAGLCGSYLYIPNLKERLKTEMQSDLALEAIKKGNIRPFGTVGENEKLSISLLDYFAQVATKIKDPGLLRILLHRGGTWDKVGCFVLSNALLEMQKNKKTMKFFECVHDALQGKKPNLLVKWKVSKDYRFCIDYLERIAESRQSSNEVFVKTVTESINELFTFLNQLIKDRIAKGIKKNEGFIPTGLTTEELTRKFEMPSQLTALFFGDGKKQDNISNVQIGQVLDNLSFPVLISSILAGASLASTRALYQNRDLLNEFAHYVGKNAHQKRALYLTDTLKDKNGVSNSLSGKLAEVQRANLPVDFLICHPDAQSESHLHVVKPVATFDIPKYGEQEIRIPDLMEISRIFYKGGYDRIVCSTEGPMAAVSLFIQQMFNVPNYFFMHTDWIDFIKCTTNLSQYERDRVRRVLRALYEQYKGVFVLNNEHKDWLTSFEMQLKPEQVHLTAHHAQKRDHSILPVAKSSIVEGATEDTPILLVACRVSKEKGLFDLPEILTAAKKQIPNLKIVVAGTGPATDELKLALPDATFVGWQNKTQLAQLYLSLDLFIFPSKFDTFGNVILESFTHGMPVLAYNCKGPKDIINHDINGYLVDDIKQMSEKLVEYFSDTDQQENMKAEALKRSKQYQAEPIMHEFLSNMGLELPQGYNQNVRSKELSPSQSHSKKQNQPEPTLAKA